LERILRHPFPAADSSRPTLGAIGTAVPTFLADFRQVFFAGMAFYRPAKPGGRPRMPVFGNQAGNRSTAANAGVTGGTGGGTPPPPDRAERTRHNRAGVKANASEASEACKLA